MSTIADRYHAVRARIAEAALRAGRSPQDVQLVVVTKGHPVEAIREAVQAGARTLGENYVEEALPKLAALGEARLSWHMIGHVQSRKARLVAENFAWVHSLDRLKLARRLHVIADAQGKRLPVLLECNVSGEASKFGWPAWDEAAWPALCESLREVLTLPGLEVRGLMTMAPYAADPEAARPVFRRLRRLRDYLREVFPETQWQHLSMGMSGDFEIAIEEGATIVRIGTAIMGKRHTP
ncbi:MAG: YggS family pyridoxal phosphate-dependent enzyme [Anaerolineae bacterium]|nr:MAG: YggS family pyridoxal phosphate-dependent enzyme [Anaerolineae bacterium]